MGVTKSDIFSKDQNKLAMIFRVLGHPARIAILQQLLKEKSCICGDLVGSIGLAQPTISQHLRELKNIGLIKGSIEGTRVCYCIDSRRWKEIRILLLGFFDQEVCDNESCC